MSRADGLRVVKRLRNDEGGFGLVELVIAMAILNIGLLALVAAFNSGAIAVRRSARVSTATALADRQMELYRALPYTGIGLTLVPVAPPYNTTPYTTDGPTGTAATPCAPAANPECMPIQNVTGPDRRTYRIDTYIVRTTPSGTPAAREVKVVRVIVRDQATPATVFARLESSFDQAAVS